MSIGEILERDEDRPAYVRFERRAVKDNEATLKAGHYVAKDEDYALITPPYSKDIVEKKVESWFESVKQNVRAGRVPEKHLDLWKESYKRWQNGQEPPLNGTSVRDWSSISPAQCQNLINAGCRTIEDLAQANDEALRRLGMGAYELKNKAKAWLQAAKDYGPLTEEISDLKNKNQQLQGTIESLQDKIKRFEIRMDAQEEERPVNRNSTGYTPAPEEAIKQSEIEANQQVLSMLRDAYKEKFGKAAHGRMGIDALRNKLKE